MSRPRHRLLIVGAREGSLGEAVETLAREDLNGDFDVETAGIDQEMLGLDITDYNQVDDFFESIPLHAYPMSIVCTVGMNVEHTIGALHPPALQREFEVNCTSVLNLLSAWWNVAMMAPDGEVPHLHHFVAISSNSAQIARSQSLGYCASKAALSMGLRVAARALATGREWKDPCPVVYGYEPGWINDTPMSREVRERLDHATAATTVHRIPGGRGIDRFSLANMIMNNLKGGKALNGCMLRLDGGEQ